MSLPGPFLALTEALAPLNPFLVTVIPDPPDEFEFTRRFPVCGFFV
jgi:hypothetical protein